MKTISGKVVYTKPISLSTAAKYLSNFTSSDHGASDAVRVYLRRTSDAFNSLVQFHKELKTSSSHRKRQASKPFDYDAKIETLGAFEENPHEEKIKKRKRSREVEGKNDGLLKIEENADVDDKVKVESILESKGNGKKDRNFDLKNEESVQIEQIPDRVMERRKKKKEKVKNEESVKIERSEDEKEGDKEMKILEKYRNNSKQESMEVEGGMDGVEDLSLKRRDKKKKKKRSEGEEARESFGGEEGKKRKSRELDGGDGIGSAEQSGKKKKKRRKTEGNDRL